MMSSQGVVILAGTFVVATGICFFPAFFLNYRTLKDNPELHDSFNNPNNIEHIIMPIIFLLVTFMPRMVWFIWPEVGTLLMSTSEPYSAAIIVPMASFALGGIFSYLKFQSTKNNISSG